MDNGPPSTEARSAAHPRPPPRQAVPVQASLLDRARLFTGLVPGSTACHRTAARIWGLNALSESEDEWPVELAVPRPAHVPGCTVHRATLPPADVTEHRSVRVTTPERTAFDCAQHLPRHDGVAIVDQFLRRGVDHDALMRRATGFRQLWESLAMADKGAASPRETWLRVILVEGGLPRPATQIRVDLLGDRLAYLDLGWPAFSLGVEYDGHEHHTSPADRHRDVTRRAALRAAVARHPRPARRHPRPLRRPRRTGRQRPHRMRMETGARPGHPHPRPPARRPPPTLVITDATTVLSSPCPPRSSTRRSPTRPAAGPRPPPPAPRPCCRRRCPS